MKLYTESRIKFCEKIYQQIKDDIEFFDEEGKWIDYGFTKIEELLSAQEGDSEIGHITYRLAAAMVLEYIDDFKRTEHANTK